jgi:hypothetical protein
MAAAAGVAADVDDDLDAGVPHQGAEGVRLERAMTHRPYRC